MINCSNHDVDDDVRQTIYQVNLDMMRQSLFSESLISLLQKQYFHPHQEIWSNYGILRG